MVRHWLSSRYIDVDFERTWWRLFCRAHYLSVPDDGYFVMHTIWAYLMTVILSCTLFERTRWRLFCRAHYLSVPDYGCFVVHTIVSVSDDGYFVVHTIWAYLMTVILSCTVFGRTWWRLFCHAHYLSVPDDGYFVVHTIWAYLMTVILSCTLFERTWWRLFCRAHYLSVPDDGYLSCTLNSISTFLLL
jgi:hypothetical protein